MPPSVEVTVRSRVFAPHKRGLQYIVVQGFTIEKAANQWIANFWFPQNYHYAQSGYGTFRLNFHRFDRFELDLRWHTQP